MAQTHPEVTVLEGWYEIEGRLSCSISLAGRRARVFQRVRGGPFYLRQEGAHKNNSKWQSLRTRAREDAIARAGDVLAGHAAQPPRLGASSDPNANGIPSRTPPISRAPSVDEDRGDPLTLRRLIDAYWAGADFEANDASTKASKTSSARILLGFFGGDQLVEEITHDNCRRYELQRRSGGFEYVDYDATPTGRLITVANRTQPAGARAVEIDLKFLRTMINWALRNWRSAGLPRPAGNPLEHFKMPREKNPRQRVMPYDRYLKIQAAADFMATSPELTEHGRLRFRMFAQAFRLAEVFGRRAGSICDLRKGDFVFDHENDHQNAYVRWRWDADKGGRSMSIPLPPEIAEQVWTYCESMPLPRSGWLFWKAGTDEPVNTDVMNDYFHAAERVAGLPPIPYMVWHSLRRAWATSRKDLPIKDAMAVGGWRDVRTFLGYQQTDPDTMLAVLRHDAKLHSDGWLRSQDGSKVGDRRAMLPSPLEND